VNNVQPSHRRGYFRRDDSRRSPPRSPTVRSASPSAATAGKAIVLKVDTERSPALTARYGVQSIPNFVVLKDGRVVLQQAGLVDAAQLGSWLAAA
jgi:hypothetical protein